MAVPAVWRLINLLAFIEPKQHAEAHRRDACAPLPKSKSKLLLVLFVFIREIRGSNAQRRRGVCMCAEVVVYRRSQTAATEKKAPGW